MGTMMACCWRRAASVLTLVLMAAPSQAAWHRLESPNFVVVGDASPRQLRDVAVRFEAFREVLGRLRGHEIATAAVPTVIVVFRSQKAIAPFTPRYQGRATEVGGLFVGGEDANYIAFVNDGAHHAARIMYHEYAHLVIANGSPRIPIWLNEGLAEVYSTFELTRDGREALIGRPIGEHLARLRSERLLKLPELLQVTHDSPLYNEGDRRSVFYAQSWALVHMINFGEPSRMSQLRAYLRRVFEGTPPSDAWAQAFGGERIEHELQGYIRRATYRAIKHGSSEKVSQFDTAATPVAPAEVHALLAHFLLAQGRREEAAAQLAAAMKIDEQSGSLRVARAYGEVAAGEHASAVQRLLLLPDAGDWLAAYHAGVALSEAIDRTRDRRPELAAAARRFFDAAMRQRVFPNAVIRRAALEIAVDHVPAEATVLAVQRARDAAPGREDYAFVHAQLLALRSEFAAARSVLGPLMSTAHDARMREAARSLMGWIVTLEQHRSRRAAAAPAPHALPSIVESASSGGPDATGLHAVFRVVKADEERVDGVLQQIDCSAGGAAVFVLTTAERTVRAGAPRLSDVDFITYREDLSGSVGCGALKTPMRVYLTSRAGARADGPRVVVAVEFLPKEMQ